MKKSIELSRKKSAYSIYVYGALDVRLFPNKRLNVDLKNTVIWVLHGLLRGVRFIILDYYYFYYVLHYYMFIIQYLQL